MTTNAKVATESAPAQVPTTTPTTHQKNPSEMPENTNIIQLQSPLNVADTQLSLYKSCTSQQPAQISLMKLKNIIASNAEVQRGTEKCRALRAEGKHDEADRVKRGMTCALMLFGGFINQAIRLVDTFSLCLT